MDSIKLYLNEKEASIRYGYSCQWFSRHRHKGTGPKFIKPNNGRVLYPLKETDEWFSEVRVFQVKKKEKIEV